MSLQPPSNLAGTIPCRKGVLFACLRVAWPPFKLACRCLNFNCYTPCGVQVFQKAGLSSPIVGSIVMGLVNVVFTLVAAHLSDRAGRRPLLLLSFAGMCASLAGVAVVVLLPTSDKLQGAATSALIMIYVAFFALGAGPVTWLYLSEILPAHIKGALSAGLLGFDI